jgi:hypothetical protein
MFRMCCHVWAAILKLDSAREGQLSFDGPVRLIPVDSLDNDGDSAHAPPASPAAKNRWLVQLSRVAEAASAHVQTRQPALSTADHGSAILYLLSPGHSSDNNRLVVLFFQRKRAKSGLWRKATRLLVDSDLARSARDAEDRYLLEAMLDSPAYTEYPGWTNYFSTARFRTGSMIAPALAEVLLPRLCATGRFGISKTGDLDTNDMQLLRWDDGAAWQLEVHVQQGPSPAFWRVSAQIKRGEQFHPATNVKLALPNGLIVLPDTVGRLASAADVGVLSELATQGAIDVPINQGDALVQQLWQWPSLPQLELPAELQWKQIRVEPRPKVRITRPEPAYVRDLSASVHFDYDGRLIGLGVPDPALVDQKNRCVVVRDPHLVILIVD